MSLKTIHRGLYGPTLPAKKIRKTQRKKNARAKKEWIVKKWTWSGVRGAGCKYLQEKRLQPCNYWSWSWFGRREPQESSIPENIYSKQHTDRVKRHWFMGWNTNGSSSATAWPQWPSDIRPGESFCTGPPQAVCICTIWPFAASRRNPLALIAGPRPNVFCQILSNLEIQYFTHHLVFITSKIPWFWKTFYMWGCKKTFLTFAILFLGWSFLIPFVSEGFALHDEWKRAR